MITIDFTTESHLYHNQRDIKAHVYDEKLINLQWNTQWSSINDPQWNHALLFQPVKFSLIEFKRIKFPTKMEIMFEFVTSKFPPISNSK